MEVFLDVTEKGVGMGVSSSLIFSRLPFWWSIGSWWGWDIYGCELDFFLDLYDLSESACRAIGQMRRESRTFMGVFI